MLIKFYVSCLIKLIWKHYNGLKIVYNTTKLTL